MLAAPTAVILFVSASKTAATVPASSIQPWLIAIFATSLGAMLAVISQVATTRLRGRRDLAYLRQAVEDEIAEIGTICRERLNMPARRVAVVTPLPNSAWNALRLSQHRSRVSQRDSTSWQRIYRAVDIVNAQAEVIPYFVQIAALAKDEDVRENYLNQAMALAREPIDGVVAALGSELPSSKTEMSGVSA
jgi:hypothetical protein